MAQDIAALLKEWAWLGEADPDRLHEFAGWRDLKGAMLALYSGLAALKVTWIPCEERMPDNHCAVAIWPHWEDEEFVDETAPIAYWIGGEWWAEGHPVPYPLEITHWAKIRWPAPPQKEEGDA